MKVAFIVDEFPSITQTFVLNQITGLIDRGHDVHIFAYRASSDTKVHEDVKRYNLLERTSYLGKTKEIMPENKICRILKGLGYIVKYIPKNALAVLRCLNIFKYGKKAASLYLLFLIIPILEKGRYHIIHCQFGTVGLKALFFRQLGVFNGKLLTSFRGFDATRYLQNRPGVYDDLFREAHLFLPVSESIRLRLLEAGCDESKMVVHHSGIDCAKFKYCVRHRAENEPTKILTIARLVEKKGVAYAIESISHLVHSGRRVTYSVIGDGVLRTDLGRLIQQLDVAPYVQLLGWRDQQEVIRLLQDSHVLVAPSITAANGDQEGIPNAVKEAMATGLPVIATTHGGMTELVDHGVSGFLVPERDVNALTDHLEYLIDHPEVWPEMGRRGRDCVKTHYDIDDLSKKLQKIYQKLLG